MVLKFAERLVRGDEEALRRAYARDQAGMFLVDWREADEDIVRLAARALKAADLAPLWRDGQLYIAYQGRERHVPLQFQPGEQDITLAALNAVLAPAHEIRCIRASEGDDTTAYLVLKASDWAKLETAHGDAVADAFGVLDPDPQARPQPSAEDLGWALPVREESALRRGIPQLRLRGDGQALIQAATAAKEEVPAVVPAFGEFVLTFEWGDALAPKRVTQADLVQEALTHDDMRKVAADHALGRVRTAQTFTDKTQTIFELRGAATFAAGVAFMSGFVEAFAEQVGGPIVAAFPNENCFAYTNGADPECVQRMIESLATMDFSGPEALSDQLYDWTPEGWVVRPR